MSRSKMVTIRVSEAEYASLIAAAGEGTISDFVRRAIQDRILRGPDSRMKEGTAFRRHLEELEEANANISVLFDLWHTTGDFKHLREIRNIEADIPDLQLTVEVDQVLANFLEGQP